MVLSTETFSSQAISQKKNVSTREHPLQYNTFSFTYVRIFFETHEPRQLLHQALWHRSPSQPLKPSVYTNT